MDRLLASEKYMDFIIRAHKGLVRAHRCVLDLCDSEVIRVHVSANTILDTAAHMNSVEICIKFFYGVVPVIGDQKTLTNCKCFANEIKSPSLIAHLATITVESQVVKDYITGVIAGNSSTTYHMRTDIGLYGFIDTIKPIIDLDDEQFTKVFDRTCSTDSILALCIMSARAYERKLNDDVTAERFKIVSQKALSDRHCVLLATYLPQFRNNAFVIMHSNISWDSPWMRQVAAWADQVSK